MSHAATKWAYSQPIKPASYKFVLVTLAYASDADKLTALSVREIASLTSLERKSVIASLVWLKASGYISETGEIGGKKRNTKILRVNGDFRPSDAPYLPSAIPIKKVYAEWGRMRKNLTVIVFLQHGETCAYCGASKGLTIDHVMPLSKGGTNDISNLRPACRKCNSSKGDKSLQEWAHQ